MSNEILRLSLALDRLDEWMSMRNGSMFGTVTPIYTNCEPLNDLIEAARALVPIPPEKETP